MAVKIKSIFILLLVALLVSQPFQSSAQASKVMRRTFSDLGFSDLHLAGQRSVTDVNIALQSNLAITQDAQVSVFYTASPELIQARSTLSILANDENVYSFHPAGDGNEHNISFTIPAELLQSKPLDLRFVTTQQE